MSYYYEHSPYSPLPYWSAPYARSPYLPDESSVCELCKKRGHSALGCSLAPNYPDFVRDHITRHCTWHNDQDADLSDARWPEPDNMQWSSNAPTYPTTSSYSTEFQNTVLQSLKEIQATTQLVHSHSRSIRRLEKQLDYIADLVLRLDEDELATQFPLCPLDIVDEKVEERPLEQGSCEGESDERSKDLRAEYTCYDSQVEKEELRVGKEEIEVDKEVIEHVNPDSPKTSSTSSLVDVHPTQEFVPYQCLHSSLGSRFTFSVIRAIDLSKVHEEKVFVVLDRDHDPIGLLVKADDSLAYTEGHLGSKPHTSEVIHRELSTPCDFALRDLIFNDSWLNLVRIGLDKLEVQVVPSIIVESMPLHLILGRAALSYWDTILCAYLMCCMLRTRSADLALQCQIDYLTLLLREWESFKSVFL